MHKVVTIRLSEAGINAAVAEMRKIRNAEARRLKKACRSIAERIRDKAQAYYDEAWVDQLARGVRREVEVKVTVETLSDGYRVVARGEEVAFVEFGAGVFFNGTAGTSPHPKGNELGLTIGSYGKGRGRRQAWGFYDGEGNAVVTRGTEAQMPLYRAFEEVLGEVRSK